MRQTIDFSEPKPSINPTDIVISEYVDRFRTAIEESQTKKHCVTYEQVWSKIQQLVPKNIQYDVLKQLSPEYYEHLFRQMTGIKPLSSVDYSRLDKIELV